MENPQPKDIEELATRAITLLSRDVSEYPGPRKTLVFQTNQIRLMRTRDRIDVMLRHPYRHVLWTTLGEECHCYQEFVPETLKILRQYMVLDDLASI